MNKYSVKTPEYFHECVPISLTTPKDIKNIIFDNYIRSIAIMSSFYGFTNPIIINYYNTLPLLFRMIIIIAGGHHANITVKNASSLVPYLFVHFCLYSAQKRTFRPTIPPPQPRPQPQRIRHDAPCYGHAGDMIGIHWRASRKSNEPVCVVAKCPHLFLHFSHHRL